MTNSESSPDSTSGTTDSVQFTEQSRSVAQVPRSGDSEVGELSAPELARLFAQSSDDIRAVAEAVDRRGDDLAAGAHGVAEAFDAVEDGSGEPTVDREQLDALATDALEGLADLERLASELHAILVAVEEGRAYLEQRDS
jgi:hypothetical protein